MFTPPKIERRSGTQSGPNILFTGALHGNESCGTKALDKFLELLDSGKITLTSGSVTAVPITNVEAHRQKKRFVNEDWNRDWQQHENPQTDREHAQNFLNGLMREADVVADIHSSIAKSVPFGVLAAKTEVCVRWALKLGFDHVLTDWIEAHVRSQKLSGKTDSYPMTMVHYAAEKLGKPAIAIEGGQHDDPVAIDFAFNSILRTLLHNNMIMINDASLVPPAVSDNVKNYQCHRYTVRPPGEGWRFTKPWRHLQGLRRGERIARNDAGKDRRAAKGRGRWQIVMPNHNTNVPEGYT